MELLWYRFVRGLVVLFDRAFWRVTVDGKEHVPSSGAFILAPVHRSNVDTPLVAAVTGRRLRFMGKDSMWKIGWIGRIFTSLGGFPVHRGTADREAMRQVTAMLEAGEPVVMFPEGARQSGPTVADLFDGPAYVASRLGVPIVPVGIGGSERAMPKGAKFIHPVKVHLVVGEPLRPEPVDAGSRVSRRAVRDLTARLRKELQALFDEAQSNLAR